MKNYFKKIPILLIAAFSAPTFAFNIPDTYDIVVPEGVVSGYPDEYWTAIINDPTTPELVIEQILENDLDDDEANEFLQSDDTPDLLKASILENNVPDSIITAYMDSQNTEYNAGDVCYAGVEGQSEESINDTKQQYKDKESVKDQLKTCVMMLVAMSPKDVINQECEDGSHPCKRAVKTFCKKKHGVPVGIGVSAALCMPFAFML